MIACVSLERISWKNILKIEHKIGMFNRTEKRIEDGRKNIFCKKVTTILKIKRFALAVWTLNEYNMYFGCIFINILVNLSLHVCYSITSEVFYLKQWGERKGAVVSWTSVSLTYQFVKTTGVSWKITVNDTSPWTFR